MTAKAFAIYCILVGCAQLGYAIWYKKYRLASSAESLNDPKWRRWKMVVSVGVGMILLAFIVLVVDGRPR